MIDLAEIQKEIVENKKRRGFNSSDVGKEIILLTEELGELAASYRDQDDSEIKDAIGDMIVYLLGLCEITNTNSEELIRNIVEKNKTRNHRSGM
ncbi:MAG: hypothetical protein HY514_04430 [Candidatus Aenigmarchaeota archaeon]|nr:hypothetical protein [Candidatus Aenigmarchaeota archaeon]